MRWVRMKVLPVQADEEGPVTEVTFETAAGAFNTQVQSIITWCDNDYGQRPSPSNLEDGFIPYYQLEGETEFKPLFVKDGSDKWSLSEVAR